MSMKRVKACLNEQCPTYKKIYYKEADEYCVKCGSKLSFVCKAPKCFKPIPDDRHVIYCPTHEGERQDKKDQRKDKLLKIGGGVVAGAGIVAGSIKTVAEALKKQ